MEPTPEDKQRFAAILSARIRNCTPELMALFGAKEKPIHGTDEQIVEELLRESTR
jgi:hypothetical protein